MTRPPSEADARILFDDLLRGIGSESADMRSVEAALTGSVEDTARHTLFAVRLCRNPRLAAAQQSTIVEGVGTKDGKAMVQVRKAFPIDFRKRLRLHDAVSFNEPREPLVVVKNRSEFDIAPAKTMK